MEIFAICKYKLKSKWYGKGNLEINYFSVIKK